MRNLTRFVAMLLMGTSLPMVSSMAQSPEPGTSYTSSIVNPTFEEGNSNGWDLDPSGSGGFSYGLMEVYNKDFTLTQTITGLPAGTYQLTADGFQRPSGNDGGEAYKAGTEKITLYLYASTGKREKMSPFYSLYSVTDLEAPEEGHVPNLNGYMNNMFAASWAMENGHYTNNTLDGILVGEDGTLTIGVKTQGTKLENSWAIFDNFNLTYMGEDALAVYRQDILELENKLADYYSTELVPSGNYNEISLAYDFSSKNSGSTEVKVLDEVIDSLTNVLARVEIVAPLMTELIDLIGTSYELFSLGYEGKDAYLETINKMIILVSPNATNENGDLIFVEDIEAGIAELTAATRTYRFTEQIKNPALGVDFTWVLQSPQFTKKGGDPSVAGDGSSEGWATNNNPAEYSQYRLNHVNGKNCWNSWNDNFVSMDVYQLLEGMPAGLYTFECYQTNNGPEVTDQHAYIKALGGTKNSPYATYTSANDPDSNDFQADAQWEGPLKTEKVLVGEDGNIRVGFASTSNGNGSSGWFCITDCRLTYYGMQDDAYEEALAELIQNAKDLLDEEMLISNSNTLSEAIAVAETVDGSDNEAAKEGLNALNKVIEETKEDILALAAYKADAYAKAVEIAENNELIYSDEIARLLEQVVLEQNTFLETSDTVTVAYLPVLTSTLNTYINFVKEYQSLEEYSINQEDPDIMTLITSVLSEQTDLVYEDGSKIEDAIANFAAIKSFSEIYLLALEYAYSEEYPAELVAQLANTCFEQYEIVSNDSSKASEAEKAISEALGDMRFSGIGIVPGDDTEVTFVIANPNTESTGTQKLDPVEGWNIEQNGNANTNGDQHYDGSKTTRYLDSWDGTPGKLKFTVQQEIKGIPNGKYRLVAAVRSSGEGAYLFAKVLDGTEAVMMPINHSEGGEIWETSDDEAVRGANDGKGFGWNWVEIDDINVNNYTMTIGVSNVPEITGGVEFTGNWFSATTFRLFWTSKDFTPPTGVENIGTDSSELIAFSENGYIIVSGAEEYSIYTLNGTQVPANAQLASGIYIVKSAGKVTKVAVK